MHADLYLARKLYDAGDAEGAEVQCLASLDRDAGAGDAYALLATICQDRGDYAAALNFIKLAESHGAADAGTAYLAGLAHYGLGDMKEARRAFERVLAAEPQNQNAHRNLGLIAERDGDSLSAAAHFCRCLDIAPGDAAARHNLYDTLASIDWDAAARTGQRAGILGHLQAGFGETGFDMTRHLAAAAAIRAGPDFQEALAAFAAPSARASSLVSEAWFGGLMDDPLLRRVLNFDIIVLEEFEFLATHMRRAALLAAQSGACRVPLEFGIALAHQAYLTEYAWLVRANETAALDALRTEAPADAPCLAILAAYAPLPDWLEDAEGIAGLGPLVRQQILEPAAEAELAAAIPSLAPVRDGASRAVKAQYEDNPFPRWSHLRRPQPGNVGATLEFLFPHFKAPETLFAPATILIAGCGTGQQSITEALRYPDSEVTAIDLSRASLAYGLRKSRALGAANIQYWQADILDLDAMDQTFDVVQCTGVLHHMDDPLGGWRALMAKLAPGGVMKIALYSETARRHVSAVRGWIAQEGLAPSPGDIGLARGHILGLAPDHAHRSMTEFADFYSISGTRDLLFHVREHQFTLPKIKAALAELGLQLIGLNLPDDRIRDNYRAMFPGDEAMTDLDNWAQLEAKQPDAFRQMYNFWCWKADGESGSGQIGSNLMGTNRFSG
jgi:2-polyprenyl-3-methyl-5-hydroxy-6-metoxy-1,4-benzoquinol methylase/tetratricopeptide (TPR) repeat protein